MLEKLKKWIKKKGEIEPFDTSSFDDPLAERIDWVPLKHGGSNFHTHRLVETTANRLEFRATRGARLFAAIFIVVGFAFPILFITTQSGSLSFYELGGILFFGLIFASAGGFMWYIMGKPRVFDKLTGMYWLGHKEPDYVYKVANEVQNNQARLSDIHAIQLIREYVRSDKNSYYSYELNLILKSGERLNVIDHGKKSEIISDADKLSKYLGVPVWSTFY